MSKPSLRRKWAFRLAPLILLLLIPVAVEMGFRLFGFGCPTSFFIRDGDYYYPNEKFARQFFGKQSTSRPVYFRVPVKKGPDTVRIFVLGESAAMGTPDPAFSFSRMLELMLQRGFPEKKFEVINAAMRGIDSHVIRHIARDCARLQPDFFVAYMGNNEVIGLHGPEPGCSRLSQSLWLMRATQWFKSSRIGQLLPLGKKSPATQDMEFFRRHRLRWDDWRRGKVVRNFGENLEDIGRASNARLLVALVPVNQKDFPPLASLPGEYSAEAQFLTARDLLSRGETNQAKAYFQRALDYDALQFRADSWINEEIRAIRGRLQERAVLVDALGVLAENEGGIPGTKVFRDHVHPTFEGDYLIARTFFAAIAAELGGTNRQVTSREECARLLAYTDWHDAQIQLAIVQLMSRPPFHDQLGYRERQAVAEKESRERVANLRVGDVERGLEIALAAVKERPDDWMLRHICVQLYQALGRPGPAVEHLDHIAKVFPRAVLFKTMLGQALAQAGRIDAAILELEQAARLDPEDEQTRQLLGQLKQRRR